MEEFANQIIFLMPMSLFLKMADKMQAQERELRVLQRKVSPWMVTSPRPPSRTIPEGKLIKRTNRHHYSNRVSHHFFNLVVGNKPHE